MEGSLGRAGWNADDATATRCGSVRPTTKRSSSHLLPQPRLLARRGVVERQQRRLDISDVDSQMRTNLGDQAGLKKHPGLCRCCAKGVPWIIRGLLPACLAALSGP